ncbi:MAG: GNAT family N-acetyltransferase [Acidimicrobiales bacterium]
MGRDREGPRVIATARLLREAEGHRIGRVCTAPDSRSRGLAAALVNEALALAGAGPVLVDAQSHLAAWYQRRGFVPTGREHVEDGIPHVEMVRP